MHLGDLRPPSALSAAIANSRPRVDTRRGYHVAAMLMMYEAHTLAPATLRARGAHADLVGPTLDGAARHEPTTATLVVVEHLFGVKLGNAEPSKDVSGGFLRWLR